MSFFDSFFRQRPSTANSINHDTLTVDMHSHLLPGIDDGADALNTSLQLISELQKLGYKKIITTPHIMGDFFKNTPEIIEDKLTQLKVYLIENNISIELEAAAEYYLDEWFVEKLDRNEKLLTFGDNYLLFELSYINEPPALNEVIFQLKSQGYKPVLAHPERYLFWHGQPKIIKEIYDKGVILQVNINSLCGYYNKGSQKMAEELISMGIVQMLGTDCHGIRHIEALKLAHTSKYYRKALMSCLNNNL